MYSEDGFQEDLPGLEQPRGGHSCASFINKDKELVTISRRTGSILIVPPTVELPSGWRKGEGEQTEQHSLLNRGLEERIPSLDPGGGAAGQSVRSLCSQS